MAQSPYSSSIKVFLVLLIACVSCTKKATSLTASATPIPTSYPDLGDTTSDTTSCPTVTPVACTPVNCTPVNCSPVNCAPVNCAPVNCTPVACIPGPPPVVEMAYFYNSSLFGMNEDFRSLGTGEFLVRVPAVPRPNEHVIVLCADNGRMRLSANCPGPAVYATVFTVFDDPPERGNVHALRMCRDKSDRFFTKLGTNPCESAVPGAQEVEFLGYVPTNYQL